MQKHRAMLRISHITRSARSLMGTQGLRTPFPHLWNHPRAVSPAWRWAVGVFAVARAWFLLWPLAITLIIPVVVQNVELFGEPVLAAFDLTSSARHVYSRQVEGRTLTFRASERGFVSDTQTGSVWSLREGRAVAGAYAGRTLRASAYSAEDVFPYRDVRAASHPALALWQRFDANWYLKIAQRGYSADDGSTVYFPLYPMLIRAVGTLLFGNDLLAALLLSNVALIGVLYLLYQIASELVGDDVARRALVYFAIFPTAFFLFAAYTESLFLLFALGALQAGRRGRWWWAGTLGALAALTRLQGFLLVVPLVYLWFKRPSHSIRKAEALALLLIPVAAAAFIACTDLSLLASYEGQLHARFVLPWENLSAALTPVAGREASLVDALNLLATLLFGAMLFPIWKKLPPVFGLFATAMFLAPLFRMTTTQPLVSMTRYVLALFPVFVLFGVWGKNRWVERAIVYVSLPLSLYLSAQFFLWGWVA